MNLTLAKKVVVKIAQKKTPFFRVVEGYKNTGICQMNMFLLRNLVSFQNHHLLEKNTTTRKKGVFYLGIFSVPERPFWRASFETLQIHF